MALGLLRDPAGLPALRTLAGDQHANTRLRVALAVALVGDPEGLDILAKLAGDPYLIGDARPVRAFAALALGVLGDPGGVEALVSPAGDDDTEVRWHAAVALGDLREEAAVGALAARTDDGRENLFVRAHAALGLAAIGSRDGLVPLRRFASGDLPETEQGERVRSIAQRALASLEECCR
jgi:HEAT repeat protein